MEDEDDDDDDYRSITKTILPEEGDMEFDQYLNAPITSFAKEKTLDWWRKHENIYPNPSHMVRDTLAVPATGVGVEREFSKSGKVATYSRSRLNHNTVTEIMMFKNFVARQGQELNDWEHSNSGLRIAEEKVDDVGVPKKWRRKWWLDMKSR